MRSHTWLLRNIILRSHLCHVFEITYVTLLLSHRWFSSMGLLTWLISYFILRSHPCHVFEIAYVTPLLTHRWYRNMASYTWLQNNLILRTVMLMSRFWDHICDITVYSKIFQQYGVIYIHNLILRSYLCHVIETTDVTLQLHTDSAATWYVL